MQSNMYASISNKIQFHGIKTVYPVGERIICDYSVTDFIQPESGDWIGIFPIGWSSMSPRNCLARQKVLVEQLNGSYGQAEFETLPRFASQQYYQFVYVTKNCQDTVLGASTPFRFGGETQQYQQFLNGDKYAQSAGEWYPVSAGQLYSDSGVFVGSEMHKLQGEFYNFEKTWSQQQQYPVSYLTDKLNEVGAGKVWQPQMAKFEQILTEKIKIEQTQRRLGQLCLLAELKSCKRHIANVQKREPEVYSFLLRNKIRAKTVQFEQKIAQVTKMNPATYSAGSVEQYVRKYEQLLKEKFQLEAEKRRDVFHKLRVTVTECERKFYELQTADQEHLVSFHSLLKSKLKQLGQRMYEQQQQYQSAVDFEMNYNKQFEVVMGSFLFEQEKKQIAMMQAQRALTCLISEMCGKLQELEFDSGCYSSLGLSRLSTGSIMFSSHPKLVEIAQLEKRIAEQKLKLKLKMLAGVPTRFVEQLARGLWFAPLIESVRILHFHLTNLSNSPACQAQQQQRSCAEKKIVALSKFMQTFAQFEQEASLVGQQSFTGLFEYVRTRQFASLLKELKERECFEIPHFFQEIVPTFGKSLTVAQVAEHLSEILTEKITELTAFTQWYQQQQFQQQIPFEYTFTSIGAQHGSALLELIQIEKKLVEMKGLALASVHYAHLSERVAELEQFVTAVESVSKRDSYLAKIKSMKALLEEHAVFSSSPSFVTIPEQYFQYQQMYEKIYQLIADLESRFFYEEASMEDKVAIRVIDTTSEKKDSGSFYEYNSKMNKYRKPYSFYANEYKNTPESDMFQYYSKPAGLFFENTTDVTGLFEESMSETKQMEEDIYKWKNAYKGAGKKSQEWLNYPEQYYSGEYASDYYTTMQDYRKSYGQENNFKTYGQVKPEYGLYYDQF